MATCVSPFKYFVDYAEFTIATNPGTTFLDVLNQENVFPLSQNICCPSCTAKVPDTNNFLPYVFTGYFTNTTPGTSLHDFFTQFEATDKCCVNILTNWTTLDNNEFANEIYDASKCCGEKNFLKCTQSILDHTSSIDVSNFIFDSSLDTQRGIFEFNKINNETLLCDMSDVLLQRTKEKALEYFTTILENGFVVACTATSVTITSLNTYILNNPTT